MSPTTRHIRLVLAREPGSPAGDPDTGYDLVAHLDAESRLDPAACRADAERCRVRRFAAGATVATGRLRHGAGNRWLLDFDGERNDVSGFADERFVPGEYVSLIGADGSSHTYRVDVVREI